MAGENALFTAEGYGSQYYRVMALDYGMAIVRRTVESANQRSVYFFSQYDDNFVTTLGFINHGEYVTAYNWFQTYMLQLANPSITTAPMTVWLPSRTFVGVGVPQSGISAGAEWDEFYYIMNVMWVGTSDPTNVDTLSQFNPTGNPYGWVETNSGDYTGAESGSEYFYPSPTGIQSASVTQSKEQALYDAPPAPTTFGPTVHRQPPPGS